MANYVFFRFAGAFILLGIMALFFSFVEAAEITKFEVNIFAEDVEQDIISIEVPDRVFLGNVSKGGKSPEVEAVISNTGSIDVIVTPQLVNLDDAYFQNLYMREQKTKTINGTSTKVPFVKIGMFSFEAAKPTSGNDYNDENFYVILDLTNYTGIIEEDLIGYTADVKFIATAQ